MYRRGRPYPRRKCFAQIEEGNGFAKREDNEPRSIASPIDAPRGLEDLGCTGGNIRWGVEDWAALLDGKAPSVWQMVVPACRGGTEAAKLVPARRMRAGGEVDAREHRVGCENEGLWGDVTERGYTRW